MKNVEQECKLTTSLHYNEQLKKMTITLERLEFGKVRLWRVRVEKYISNICSLSQTLTVLSVDILR